MGMALQRFAVGLETVAEVMEEVSVQAVKT
jgi:hypothetical protein